MKRAALGLGLSLALMTGNAYAAEPEPLVGHWLASDDDTPPPQRVSSVVEVYLQDKRLNARIIKTMDAQGNEISPICERCPGELRGRPTKGVVFVRDLRKDGTRWTDGSVMDLRDSATQGIVASCDLTLVDGKAVLLGYLGFRAIGKTSTWTRLADAPNDAGRNISTDARGTREAGSLP